MSSAVQLPDLLSRIEQRTATTAVIGLGYVGLPLLNLFHAAGLQALGLDIDPVKVSRLMAGQSYIGHIHSDRVAEMVRVGRFVASTDFSRLRDADTVSICVPTPLTDNRDPDLSFVQKTAHSIAPHLRRGQLIVLESTTYPGTTRDVLRPILEQVSGLRAGRDFWLAYSPEREDPGNRNFSTATIPKVVGGIDDDSLTAATALYKAVTNSVVPVSSLEVAEACKILENTYRAVNIALVNEMKILFDRMGLSMWEVIAAAKTKPFGFQAFYPGPGLGGHCIPIDPFYLTWLARRFGLSTRFIELAGEVNSNMPRYIVERTVRALNDRKLPVNGTRIGIIGIAYKKDVDDPRESPAFEILEELEALGAVLSYHDPHIPQLPRMRKYDLKMDSSPLEAEWIRSQAVIIIVTDHSNCDWKLVARHASLVIDPRNALAEVAEKSATVIN